MSEAPAGSCRGIGDERYKARWVLPRELGSRHIGLYNPFYKKRPGGRFGELVYPLFL